MTRDIRASENKAVQQTLLSSYCPATIKEARTRQDEILIERYKGGAYKIADLGCGDGYHGSIFAPTCDVYHGFEIAPDIAAIAESRWRKAGLHHATVFVGDAIDAELPDAYYDLVFCLYFTPGNFRDKSEDLALYTNAYLDRNPVFIRVMSKFYGALKPAGRMLLTVYKDVPAAEASQIDFYLHTGQHVVTPRGSRFVMTRENFWSVRWTQESMLSNLTAVGIAPLQVTFNDLNDIAWLVEITKPA